MENIVSILDDVVFLDLETSGLNPRNSEILEIGAIKVVDKKIYKFETLVKNRFKVSPEIFSLCNNLNQNDLDKAPVLEDIKDDFLSFIGDKTVICHNKSFEMEFLDFYIGEIKNEFLDSMELAVILEPYHREFNLDYLKKNITSDKTDEKHRAIYDVIDTINIVNALILRFKRGLESENRLTLYPLTFDIDSYLNKHNLKNWQWSYYINEADFDLEKDTNVIYSIEESTESSNVLEFKEKRIDFILNKNNFNYEELLKDENIWSSKKGFMYEFRKGQFELTKSIRNTFDKTSSNILCIEAPTGIGKSVGYILPAVLEAKYNKKRTIISTATKELQVQLIQKDIPNVINSLGLSNKISYGYIKGKNNYICRSKFEEYKKNYKTELATYDDILSIIIIENLIKDGKYADIEEINYWAINHFKNLKKHINKVICDADLCKPKKCTELCLYKTRIEELAKEDITVVNHSLLAKWPYIDEKPLENLIVDEAHNLAEKGYDFFSREIDYINFKHLIAELYPYDFIADCNFFNREQKIRKIKSIDKFYKEISLDKEERYKLAKNMNFILGNMQEILQFPVKSHYDSLVNYGLSWEINLQRDEIIAIIENKYSENIPITYGPYSDVIKYSLDLVLSEIKKILFLIDKYMDEDNVDKESEYYKYGKSKLKNLEDTALVLEKFLEDDDNDLVARIVDVDSNFNNYLLKVVPLNLNELFKENILSILESGVFISATLSVDNKMDYFINTLGIDMVKNNRKIIEPIYDYKGKLDVVKISDMGGYKSDDFIEKIGSNIENLLSATNSNVLCLFNSKSRQDDTYEILEEELHKIDISIYKNKKGIKFLKNTENKSVVLGSKGCFEGVDVPGDGLICVTLDKIPNLNPKDPLYFSLMTKRKRTYTDVNYPQMIIKVKQALGRILRSKYDYGVFVLFDTGSSKNIQNLEKNLHGCKIKNIKSDNLKLYVESSLKEKRKMLMFFLIKELVNNYKVEQNQENVVEYLNREIKNRSINANIKGQKEKNKILLEYYNIKYIVDIEKI